MRHDSIGFFWEDLPPEPKAKKEEVVKYKLPDSKFWDRPDFIPRLEEAHAYRPDYMTDAELVEAQRVGDVLFVDVESYDNYFLCSFMNDRTGKVVSFRAYNEFPLDDIDQAKLKWIMQSFLTVGFNSLNYDLAVITLAYLGKTAEQLKGVTTSIITVGMRPWQVLRNFKVKQPHYNHIDLIEVAPLRASLKIYGGRLHTARMQDLPIHPDATLNADQILATDMYNIQSDLPATQALYRCLHAQLDLREKMSQEYDVDLRSKSDAQIAEAVIRKRIEAEGITCVVPGTEAHSFHYDAPAYMSFRTELMQSVFEAVRETPFEVGEDGVVRMPDVLRIMKIRIGQATYKLGIGGLHSTEKAAHHIATGKTELADFDVTSYYPSVILGQRLYPKQLTPRFLDVYEGIVTERIAAKKAKDNDKANTLKIVINGSFGKFGSPYSVLYSPKLLIQVTVTGQLSLLMLIETFELAGITVVSANTDGIVTKYQQEQRPLVESIIKWWETITDFETEETRYKALYSRDVNNYIAVKLDDSYKGKGAFAAPTGAQALHKNPQGPIVYEAVAEHLIRGVPLADTIHNCKDIRKFLHVRKVEGGAVKVYEEGKGEAQYLGKNIRWYYGKEDTGAILVATKGAMVPKTVGAIPCLDLPDTFPEDVDHAYYITEAEKVLQTLGV